MARILALCLLSIFLISGPTFASKSKTQEMESLTKQIKQNTAKIKQKKQLKKKEQASLYKINKDLRFTEKKLTKTKKDLTFTKRRITSGRRKLRTLQKEYNKKKRLLEKRVVDIYKNKQSTWISFIFMPSKFQDMADSPYFFEKLLKMDVKILEDVKLSNSSLRRQQSRLSQQEKRYSSLQKQIKRSEQKLSRKKKQQASKISSLDRQISKIEKENRDLKEASRQIGVTIRELAVGDRGFYGTGKLFKPVKGWISSKFGMRKHPIFKRRIPHNGIDFAAPKGYKIRAADAGKIIVAGEKRRYRGYGKVTVIDHGRRRKDGKRISTLYAHQSRILVKVGDIVKKGDEIGWVGATGYATGPHLHFEMRLDGKPTNPMKFFKKSYL